MLDINHLNVLESFRDLSQEKKDAIVLVINQTEDYTYDLIWKKGNRTFTTDKMKNILMVNSWPFSPLVTMDALNFCENNAESINNIKTAVNTPTQNSIEDEFNQAFYENLVAVKWTELDELAWKDIKYTNFGDKTLIIAPTGRGKEFKVIGQESKEVYSNLVSIDRLEYMSENVVKPLNKMIYGQKFVTKSELKGDKLPGSIAGNLYKPKAIWGNQTILGMTLTALKPISVQDYIKESFEDFKNPKNEIKIEKVISNDPNEPCFRFIDLNMKKGDCTTWMNWMKDTFENHEVTKKLFMAWVGSVVVAKNNSKQIFWLHGFGNDAKTQVINALSEYLGNAAVALDKNSLANQFGFAKLENKRLVTISDNKNSELLRTSFLHKCSGNDFVDIERKGKDSYSSKLFAKIIVCENIAPTINADEINQVTRLIYVKCKKKTEEECIRLGIGKLNENGEYVFIGNSEFPKKLVAETEAFIAECLEVYKTECPTDSAIAVPKSYIEEYITTNCADISESFDIDILNKHLEKGSDDDFVETNEFWNKIVDIFNGNFDKRNYKHTQNINKLITNIFNCRIAQKRIDGTRTRCYVGIKFKKDSLDDILEISGVKKIDKSFKNIE